MELKFTNDFEIEDLGIQEKEVYDLEVGTNHNFFSNGILVHNSVYYHIAPFMEEYINKNPSLSIDNYVDYALEFENKYCAKIVDDTIEDFATKLNAFDKSKIGAKVEICADVAIFIAKKRYIARVRDDEGTRYPENSPKLKIMGLEIARSSTPKWCRDKLKESIPILFDKDEKYLKLWFNKIKLEYSKQSISDIATIGTVNSIDYNLGDKNIPIGSKSAIVFNKYIKEHNLMGKYVPIKAGDKIKRIYLKIPNKFNSNVIAFNTDDFIHEIDCVDYEKNFEKTFISPLEIMITPLKYKLINSINSIENW